MAQVLVVDDDAAIRQLLTFAFSMEGHSVETLSDGRDVVEKLRASSERVIVFMDVMMPHMDGLEVCHLLVEAPELLSRHAVVLMSAGFVPGQPLPVVVQETLAKPFNLESALQLIEQFDKDSSPLAKADAMPAEVSAFVRPA